MSATSIVSTPLKYLDKAVNSLRDLGLMPAKPEEAPITALIEQVSDLDEEKALAIARTLSHTSVFNEVVREQITQMKVGERYEKITEAFNSIRDDAKSMVDQLDDGKISTLEKLQNAWMKLADFAATTISQASARFAPAPAATPLTAQTTGSGSARNASTSGL